MRIAVFVPLIIATIASAFLCVIGFALKICFTPPALDRFKHFSILDDAPTQLYLPDNSEKDISPESAKLFSTFNQDCINYVLTFLSFRDKRRFLQISQHFKKVIEESPTWNLYCEGLDNPVMRQFEHGRIDLFDNNLDHLRWVFTPAFETFYKPLAKCGKFSLVKELPKETITINTIKYYDPYEGFFEDNLTRVLNHLIDKQYCNNYCFRVIFSSPGDGWMGEGIAFHNVSQDVDQRHFFVSYGDPNEGPIYTCYWKGKKFEETPYKEKYLISQFKAYADNLGIDLSLSGEMSSGEDISSQESSEL